MDNIIIDREYRGYVYMGEAHGRFLNDKNEMQPYHNLYVISPVSSFKSDDYEATGFKAEKKSCTSADVLAQGLKPGDHIKLFFDDKKRVQMVALDE